MAVQISHVRLCVSDLERSLRFYSEGLGFEVQERIPGDDGFAAPDGTRVELLQRPPA